MAMEKFTEDARRVLMHAQEEAQRFNHHYIGTEHILLGLTRARDGLAARILLEMGVDTERVRGAVEFIIGRGQGAQPGEVGLTPRAQRVIELAVDEARLQHHPEIRTEHLLVGLLREGEGIAAGVLESLGVNLEGLRRQVVRHVGGASGAPSTVRQAIRRERGIAISLNQTESDLLDTMVDAGAADTREDAARWLLRSGIDASAALLDSLRETAAEIQQLRDSARLRAEQAPETDTDPSNDVDQTESGD